MIRSLRVAALPALLVLSGCLSTTQLVPHCCYQGAVATTRLDALSVRTSDGRQIRFADALPGFAPQDGVFTTPLPFEEALGEDIIYSSLQPLLPIYDANGDGRLERPEVTVLVAREAARATGTPVEHLAAAGDPVWAVQAPNADIGGLMTWANARRASMTPEGRAVFRDLERLGQDLLLRGGDGPGPDERGGVRVP